MQISATVQAAGHWLPRCAMFPGWFLSRRKFLRSSLGTVLVTASPAVRAAARLFPSAAPVGSTEQLRMQFSFGHNAAQAAPFVIRLTGSGGVKPDRDQWQGNADAGNIQTQSVVLSYPRQNVKIIQQLQTIWGWLIDHSDEDTVRRLTGDPAWRVDSRELRIECNAEGTSGFTVTIDQLLRASSMWIPALDLYIACGDSPKPLQDYLSETAAHNESRILDRVHREPEASYEQFCGLWEDMGNPAFTHPRQEGPGHIVCLSWDSAIAKFGIDRGGGVWNDYGNPDHFRFWFSFGNLGDGIVPYWKSQSLTDGLPVITTVYERDNIRYELEQFSYPLNGPPQTRNGEIAMLLLQRVVLTNLSDEPRSLDIGMVHQRRFPADEDADIGAESKSDRLWLLGEAHRDVLLAVHASEAQFAWAGATEPEGKMNGVEVTVSFNLPASGIRELFVTLPSQVVKTADLQTLEAIDYAAAKKTTLEFWSGYLDKGATFNVPERPVNDLFRASLWHALRLPRRHSDGTMDLPFSNFAYSQTGTPWPINQAVYVDYMLYGLRGYDVVAAEEIAAIYHNNQEFSGHLNGNADWLTYTPGMLYAFARNFLLSGDRDSFNRALPQTLRALDWSLAEVCRAADSDTAQPEQLRGLVEGPLNDLTGSGYWAFNQAYLCAGLQMIGIALARIHHPRAQECSQAAEKFRSAVYRAFQLASVSSFPVQLRDHSWIPFVPSQATKTSRNFEMWYPSDVDTGPVHLLRLGAIPPHDPLAEFMLNDHEDNLFLHGWGMANEPVYNQQATAYLLRDDPKAAIRAFYSYMACAFSHSAFEPVEHRWCWGQYFGPPSTDGAWSELYRNMLVREADESTLLIGQATPRAWLQDGKRITVKAAPTWFGKVSFEIDSHAQSGSIRASLHLEPREPIHTILLRLRHPDARPMSSVTVNGEPWQDFDRAREWVRITNPGVEVYSVVAGY